MADFLLSNSDFESFSKYLGFSGLDVDMFYETYYLYGCDEFECESELMELELAEKQ